MSKEGITQKGPGVQYKPTVSVRSDKISGHGDMKMSNTKSAYSNATDNKKG